MTPGSLGGGSRVAVPRFSKVISGLFDMLQREAFVDVGAISIDMTLEMK